MSKTDKSIKYFIYCRKSTESDDRQVLSIDSQINALEEIANKNNFDVIREFKESKSAKEPGREVFNEMLDRIEAGEAQGILCWKVDRIARNPIDSARVHWLLQRGVIKHIKTGERDYWPEDSVLLMTVEFGMANEYIRQLSQNVMRGMLDKCRMGWRPGRVPLGYVNEKSAEKGKNKVLIDEKIFPLLRKAFDLMLTGVYLPSQILDKINNEWGFRTPKTKTKGGRPMSVSTIYRLFNDEFYYGRFEWPIGSGQWYDGQHQPMITEDEYWRIQHLLGRKGRPRPQHHHFAFTGFIECAECSAMVTASHKVKKIKATGELRDYIYYHCTKRKAECGQSPIRLEDLEMQIDQHLAAIQIPEDFKNWAIKYLDEVDNREVADRETIRKSQQELYDDLEKQLNNLTKLRLRDQITDAEYDLQRKELTQQRDRISRELKGVKERGDDWREMVEKTFDFACHARHLFANGDLQAKKTIFSALGGNFKLKDRILQFELQKPFEIVSDGYKNILENINRLEPKKSSRVKTKTAAFRAATSDWSG